MKITMIIRTVTIVCSVGTSQSLLTLQPRLCVSLFNTSSATIMQFYKANFLRRLKRANTASTKNCARSSENFSFFWRRCLPRRIAERKPFIRSCLSFYRAPGTRRGPRAETRPYGPRQTPLPRHLSGFGETHNSR